MTEPPPDGGRTKVVVALDLAPALRQHLADYDVTYITPTGPDDGDLGATVADAEGILLSSNLAIGADVMDRAPALRVISTMSVGLDHIDLVAAGEHHITVTNTPVLSDAVADLTLALMTMLSRRLPEAMRAVADGGWHVALGGDLADKTLLLVGFGRIGQAVAVRARAAGMRVTYVDPSNALPDADGATRVGSLAQALTDADFVSLHVDLNPATRGLMGAPEFALMKPTAFLINTARGAVVDQGALTAALAGGHIAGAGLDVLETEPPPADEPLLGFPNVIVVPHIGSATTETRHAMARCAVDNLRMVLSGEGSPFVVPRVR